MTDSDALPGLNPGPRRTFETGHERERERERASSLNKQRLPCQRAVCIERGKGRARERARERVRVRGRDFNKLA